MLILYFCEVLFKVLFSNLHEILGRGFPEAVQLNVAVFRYSTSCSSSGEMVIIGATEKQNRHIMLNFIHVQNFNNRSPPVLLACLRLLQL